MGQLHTAALTRKDLGAATTFIFDQGYRDSDGRTDSAAHNDVQQEATINRHVQDAFATGALIALKNGSHMIGIIGFKTAVSQGDAEEETAEINILEIEDAERNKDTLRALFLAARDAAKALPQNIEWLEINERPRTHMAILLDELAREKIVRFAGRSWLRGLSYVMEVDALKQAASPQHENITYPKQMFS